jgi:hypothetical protein
MTWVAVSGDKQLRCVFTSKKDKPYRYEEKDSDGKVTIVAQNKSSPVELAGGELYRYLKKEASNIAQDVLVEKFEGNEKYITSNLLEDESNKQLISLKNELEDCLESEAQHNLQEAKAKEKEIQEKYDTLNASFNGYCMKYNMTPLELIVATSHCLGVGNPREIINAFFGYFQTYTGIKATNVIAVGNQASGKSFMLENALSMIPSERVHRGVDTVAYFFNKYNGKDLSGHIFFLGDLGGELDDADTLKLRDTLKELTTDGYKKRGVMNTQDMEEEDQFVTGYPCLSYTTANEEIINDQERSRSIILTPQILDSEKLVIYDALQEAKGKYYTALNQINHITRSVQGFTYNYDVEEKDFFNPYMFTIQEHLKDHVDITRKNKEYNAVLEIVTCLYKPFELKHNIYLDDAFNEKETPIVIASMQDNINALNVFSASNLLPDEIKFANGLINEYDVVPINVLDEDFDKGVQDWVIDWLVDNEKAKDQFEYNAKIDEEMEELKDYVFSVETLKKKHRNKQWFRKSGAKNASNRLTALYNEGILIKVGKSTHGNMNVYALNKGMNKPIEEVIPEFKAEHLEKAKKLFKQTYPDLYPEFEEFVENDSYTGGSLFETVKPIIDDLPYLDGGVDELQSSV